MPSKTWRPKTSYAVGKKIINNLHIDPVEIYTLAKLANNDEPPEKPKRSPQLKEDYLLSKTPLYNLLPDDTIPRRQSQPIRYPPLKTTLRLHVQRSGGIRKRSKGGGSGFKPAPRHVRFGHTAPSALVDPIEPNSSTAVLPKVTRAFRWLRPRCWL